MDCEEPGLVLGSSAALCHSLPLESEQNLKDEKMDQLTPEERLTRELATLRPGQRRLLDSGFLVERDKKFPKLYHIKAPGERPRTADLGGIVRFIKSYPDRNHLM